MLPFCFLKEYIKKKLTNMKKITILEREADEAAVANNVAEVFEKELVELIQKYSESLNESSSKGLAISSIQKVLYKHSINA